MTTSLTQQKTKAKRGIGSPKRQILYLFLITMLMYTVGSGIMSLVALHAQHLGGTPTEIGISLAIAFAAIALSTLSTGWFSNRFNDRKRFTILAITLSIPTAYLLSHANHILHLTIGITVLWFLFGIVATMVNILAGLHANQSNRGMIFGIIGAALPTGQFIGSLFAGPIVDQWGYPAMYTASALVYGVTLLASFLIVDVKLKEKTQEERSIETTEQPINMLFLLLMVASVFAFSVSFMTSMARPLIMELKEFSPTAISSVSAIAGIVTLPLPLLAGWVSDRIGRRSALVVCYLLPAIGVALMMPASILWHFWLAQSLVTFVNITQTVGSALIGDLVQPSQLSTYLSRYNATVWIGAVVGFTGTGFLIQIFGLIGTFGVGVVVLLLALPLVLYATHTLQTSTRPDLLHIPPNMDHLL